MNPFQIHQPSLTIPLSHPIRYHRLVNLLKLCTHLHLNLDRRFPQIHRPGPSPSGPPRWHLKNRLSDTSSLSNTYLTYPQLSHTQSQIATIFQQSICESTDTNKRYTRIQEPEDFNKMKRTLSFLRHRFKTWAKPSVACPRSSQPSSRSRAPASSPRCSRTPLS